VHSGFGGGPITFNNACGMTFDWTSGTHGVPLSQTMSNCDWFDGNPAQLKNPLVNGNPAYNGCVSYYPNTVGCPTTSSLFPNANQ